MIPLRLIALSCSASDVWTPLAAGLVTKRQMYKRQ